MEKSGFGLENPKKRKRAKNAHSTPGCDRLSQEQARRLYRQISSRLESAEVALLVAQSIAEYRRSYPRGRPAKVLETVVTDLVFTQLQRSLDRKPRWYKKVGDDGVSQIRGDSSPYYWFKNSTLWWVDLWATLRPEFEDLMVLALPQKPTWDLQVRRLIQRVLQAALTNRDVCPTVMQVPPGLGKTTGTIEALCKLPSGTRVGFKGDHLKILWFVRESRVTEKMTGTRRTSLGSEALLEFERCGAAAQVIESKHDGPASKTQIRRAQWRAHSAQPEVRILAHAYLPLMFRDASATGAPNHWLNDLKEQADLVVIDEDPAQSLVFSETDLPDLPNWPELVTLMEMAGVLRTGEGALKYPHRPEGILGQKDAYWEPVREQPDQLFRGTYQTMTLEDHDAWMRLWADTLTAAAREGPSLSSTDVWARYGQALFEACSVNWRARLSEEPTDAQVKSEAQILGTKLDDFLRALRVDLMACLDGAPSRLRFGLLWIPDQQQQVELRLRFSVLKPLTFTVPEGSGRTLPVVILDAYADEWRYQKLFGPSTSVVRLEHDAAFELQVEQLDLAKELRKFTVTTGFAQRHLLRLMTESTLLLLDEHQRLPRPVLFLGPQAVTSGRHVQRRIAPVINAQESYQFGHRWLHYLTPVQESTETSERFQSAYWFAGRGRNQFAGSDVVALTPPRYPGQYQHQLAAVAPATIADDEERKRLSKHDETAELLQMLHRGRQVLRHLQRPGSQPLRVLVLFDTEEYELSGKATVRPLEVQTADLPQPLHQKFSYARLGGLPLKGEPTLEYPLERGKLELTKMVGVGVLMELLGRVNSKKRRRQVQSPQEPELPEGWLPEGLLVRLGILARTQPDSVFEESLIRAYLDQLELPTATPHSAPSFRFTAAALQRAGLWETMPLGRKLDPQAWAPPGTAGYLKPQLRAFFEERFGHSVLEAQHPIASLGNIWYLEGSDVAEIQSWSYVQMKRIKRQDRGGHKKEQDFNMRTALLNRRP